MQRVNLSMSLSLLKHTAGMELIRDATTTAWIFAVFLGISGVLALYRLALPRPFPGIPYNAASANRIMGDLPEFEKRQKCGLTAKSLWSSIASEAGSPIAQSFMLPFTRPWIIIADYGEVKDLLLRRARHLGRGSINNQVWSGLVPDHFIAMEEHDARYKAARSLVQDLMTPKFIHSVRLHQRETMHPQAKVLIFQYRSAHLHHIMWHQSSSTCGKPRPSQQMGGLSMLTTTWVA